LALARWRLSKGRAPQRSSALAPVEGSDIVDFEVGVGVTGDLAARESPADTASIAGRGPISRTCHSGDDYAAQFIEDLPTGQAWPREPGSILVNACTGLNQYWGYVDERAGDLLEFESDPRKTTELLPDWERAWGLPDPCFPPTISLEDRRIMLVFKMTLLGEQSREFFQRISAWVGYPITIGELAPYMCGVSEVGDTRNEYDDTGLYRWYLGDEEMRFFWSVNAESAVIDWMRVGNGGGEVGVHHMLEFQTQLPIECLLQRWKPAHTEMTFDYSSLVDMGPDVGLP
jgi:uncharacterized protein YmfQ (DUF2313 family)